MKEDKFIIVTPSYNDWESLNFLFEDLKKSVGSDVFIIDKIVVVNDASFKPLDFDSLVDSNPFDIEIINLAVNVGHQRAIAIGLAYVYENINSYNAVVVMDCDGEDSVLYIADMLSKAVETQKITFAKRIKRSESYLFKFGYFIYKRIFKLLTNEAISFGNFCAIPKNTLKRIVLNPDIWNHFSGSIIKSKMAYSSIPTNRSKRYSGDSKMNFQRLVIHGLSSISIYIEVFTFKILVISMFGLFILMGLAMLVLYLKWFTVMTIPGWASAILVALLNTGGVLMIITLILFMMQLHQRNVVSPHILSFYNNYFESIDKYAGK